MEALRPDVVIRREKYLRELRAIPVERLVFLDESGMNLSMSRSHAWVKRGTELVDRVPMNWGGNLTVLGAIRLSGWVVQSSMFATTNKERFLEWVRTKLLPRLKSGDIIVMDNLSAHHDPRVQSCCAKLGVTVMFLPPYSPDLNPIEPGWALQKKLVRRIAPRSRQALVDAVRHARRKVSPRHSRAWFKHAGYQVN